MFLPAYAEVRINWIGLIRSRSGCRPVKRAISKARWIACCRQYGKKVSVVFTKEPRHRWSDGWLWILCESLISRSMKTRRRLTELQDAWLLDILSSITARQRLCEPKDTLPDPIKPRESVGSPHAPVVWTWDCWDYGRYNRQLLCGPGRAYQSALADSICSGQV